MQVSTLNGYRCIAFNISKYFLEGKGVHRKVTFLLLRVTYRQKF